MILGIGIAVWMIVWMIREAKRSERGWKELLSWRGGVAVCALGTAIGSFGMNTYLYLLLILAGIVFFIAGMIREGRNGNRLIQKIGALIGTVLLILPVFLFVMMLFVSFSRYPTAALWIFWSAFGLIAAGVGMDIFKVFRKRILKYAYFALLGLWALAAGGFYGWQAWDESILRVDDSAVVLNAYIPGMEGSLCAELDEPSEFTFSGVITMDGATALYPVYASFAQATFPDGALDGESPYVDTNPVRCTTTTEAYRALAEGRRDIIFVAGSSDAQIEYARSLGEEMVFTPIGREAFVFFVNSRNPVQNLTVDQLRGVYSGDITEWEELGADMGAIRAFQRDEGSGSQTRLTRFMGDVPLMEAPQENVVQGMGGIIRQTADYKNYKNAIGYSFRFYATEMVPNDQICLLAVNGIEPTAENIANSSYPLSGEFYAVRLESNKNPEIDAFIEWILSPQVNTDLIEKGKVVYLGRGDRDGKTDELYGYRIYCTSQADKARNILGANECSDTVGRLCFHDRTLLSKRKPRSAAQSDRADAENDSVADMV